MRKKLLFALTILAATSVMFSCGSGSSSNSSTQKKEMKEMKEEHHASMEQSSQDGEAVKRGLQYAQKNGCLACHAVTADGTQDIGTSFVGLYGSMTKVVVNGATKEVKVDEAYIEKSLKEPNAELVEGYNALMPPVMPTDAELKDFVAYLKSLK